ncbi:unnamed protein product [Cladocopium goreaui]|uniref:60S acidic ribosomal protein P2 n=1 Tax=Cladocopium goreaui TaxID=2562237 RepID=A0A9P1FMC6_9DINO|nr:unnamed protein product [Cladocopium goreaui]
MRRKMEEDDIGVDTHQPAEFNASKVPCPDQRGLSIPGVACLGTSAIPANWSYTGIHNPHVFFLQLFITTRCKNYAEYSHLAKILLQEARVPYHENGRNTASLVPVDLSRLCPRNAATVGDRGPYAAVYYLCRGTRVGFHFQTRRTQMAESVDSEYDESIASKLVSELEGKVVHEVVAAGKEKLKGFGGGGGGGPVAATGGGAAAAGGAAEKKEEKKVVEEEEEEEMEFDLFG